MSLKKLMPQAGGLSHPSHESVDPAIGEFALDAVDASVSVAGEEESKPYVLPTPVDWGEVEQGYLDIDFVFPGLTVGGLGMIAAPGGTGKSYAMLSLAASVAMGRALIDTWEEAEPAKVMLFFAEDPKEIIHNRLRSLILTEWVRSSDRTDDRTALLRENMVVRSMVGVSSNVAKKGKFDPQLHASEFAIHLEREISQVCPRLVVLDPFRQFHSEDENDAAAMTALLQLLHGIAYRNQTSIIFAHHTNKNATLSGQGDAQQAARGSSAITDNVRWQTNMAIMSEEECGTYGIDIEVRKKYVRMILSKANYTEHSNDIWFKRSQGGILEPISLRPVVKGEVPEHMKKDHDFNAMAGSSQNKTESAPYAKSSKKATGADGKRGSGTMFPKGKEV